MGAAIGFGLKHWRLVVGGIGALLLGLYILSIKTENARLGNTVEQRNGQIASIKAANERERLARQNEMLANRARVTIEQEAINDEVETRSLASAADWRARFERLRNERQRRSPGAALPAASAATGSADGSDHDPREPADPEMIAVRIDDLETLVQGAQRGADLQDWAARQAKVVTSPE
jgi:hypothetical protein